MKIDSLTQCVTCHMAGAIHDGLCFGDPVRQVIRKKRTIHYFRPGQRFGVLWWRRDFHGRQHRIFAAVEAGQPGHLLLGIHREVAVHSLMHQSGPAGQDGTVDQLLDLIEDLKWGGTNPAEFPGEFWSKTQQNLLLNPLLEPVEVENVLCFA